MQRQRHRQVLQEVGRLDYVRNLVLAAADGAHPTKAEANSLVRVHAARNALLAKALRDCLLDRAHTRRAADKLDRFDLLRLQLTHSTLYKLRDTSVEAYLFAGFAELFEWYYYLDIDLRVSHTLKRRRCSVIYREYLFNLISGFHEFYLRFTSVEFV